VPIQTKNRVVECGTTANRIRERAIARKLDAYLDPNFDDASYAFRPGRSPETAILCVRDTIRKGAHWALKTDIAHFFDSVDRRILDHLLAQVLRDRDLRCAIMVAISPVIVSGGTSLYRQKGLPQGNGIAPILSNLYLHLLDESCSRFQYFRYADDILVLAATREEVEEALNHIRRVTTLLRLQLSEEKNQIRDLYREPVKFLGYEVRGGNIYVPKESVAKFVQN
jgi:CRISPR-associated protein Cas1